MKTTYSNHACDDRVLLVDDTDEDMPQLITVICDGNPRSYRGFEAATNGGFA